VSEKIIHFGEFIRWQRVQAGKTTEALGREVGLTARRLIAIEAMATPEVQHTTMAAFARAFGHDPEDFGEVWKKTPVPVTRRKPGPTTEEATRFASACAAAGTTQVEGLRRLRSWIVEQDRQTQIAALSFVKGTRPSGKEAVFTDPVDHLQDPADGVKKRVVRKAAATAAVANRAGGRPPSRAKSPGSDAKGESKRR
jgi:transcriptional regulator with XRE-family HTH domain